MNRPSATSGPAAASGQAPDRALTGGARDARPPLVDSTELLQGHRTVEIRHNGELYRLQATRLGKLILTK